MRLRRNHTRLGLVILAGVSLAGPRATLADVPSPSERYYVRVSEIHDAALREARGVLNLIVAGSLQDMERPFTPPLNPAFVGWDHQFFKPAVATIPTYTRSGNAFAGGATLQLSEMFPISAALDRGDGSSGPLLLRFPVTAISGPYREIVYHPVLNLRSWVKMSDHAPAAPLKREGLIDKTETTIYREISFDTLHSRPGPAGWIDIFARAAGKTRELFERPEAGAAFTTFSPSSPSLQAYRQASGHSHDGLYFQQIQNGFGELWLDGHAGAPPRALGWLKLRDAGYHRFLQYFGDRDQIATLLCVDVFVFGSLERARTLHQRPDPTAPTTVLTRETLTAGGELTGEVFITRIENSFALLGVIETHYEQDDDGGGSGLFCESGPCGDTCQFVRPLGWLRIRDADGRLTIWPVIPFSRYLGC